MTAPDLRIFFKEGAAGMYLRVGGRVVREEAYPASRGLIFGNIGSYFQMVIPHARRCNSAQSSGPLNPMARAVVSARLSLGARTIPMAASVSANWLAADGPEVSTTSVAGAMRSSSL